MKYLAAYGLIAGSGMFIWLGVHFGSRWIDKMLCVPPPIDPSKPIVRPTREAPRE